MFMAKEKERTVGMELRLYRTERHMSLREAAEKVGISENYMSEIERNKKNPNDDIVRMIAIMYGLDEMYLFERFDRVPLVVQEELKGHESFSHVLYDIATKLPEEEKQQIYSAIERLYKTHFKKE